jgi:GNAT superfamily N-acetyltransferase
MGEVIPATSPQEIKEAIALREAVLLREGGRESVGRDPFDGDPTTVHCLVRTIDGACVGAGRLVAPVVVEKGREVIEGNPTIGPIVVVESARGRGIGRAILTYLEDEALAIYGRNGVVRVEAWVPSRVADGAEGFGYEVNGGEGGDRSSQTGVFRDLTADAIGDAREGPPAA